MDEKALTTREIARYCDVTPRTVIQWIGDGKIVAYRTPGNHSRVKRKDFLKFLKNYNMPVPKELEGINGGSGRKKILIVDDDKNMARSIKRVLTLKEDYELEMAFDGFDAGRKVVMFQPDLVILDIKMPGLNGYDVAKKIKEMPEISNTKIIAISAFFEQEGKDKILSLGAEACLDKPFSQEVLLQAIKDVF